MDRTETITPTIWQSIYTMADKFAYQGESLSSRLQVILAGKPPWKNLTCQDSSVYSLFCAAQNERQRILGEYHAAQADVTNPSDSQRRMLAILKFQSQVAKIRAQPEFFGDRSNITQQARRSGLVREIHETFEEIEAELANMTEHIDEVLYPRWEHIQRDFSHRVERGAIVEDRLSAYRWTDVEHVCNVGPRTCVTEITTPVKHLQNAQGEQCPICLDPFVDVSNVIRSKCAHLTHADCLDTWINSLAEKCNTCPLCRSELFPRRPRKASNFVVDYLNTQNDFDAARTHQAGLRHNISLLSDILDEIEPGSVVASLGR